MGTHVLEEYRPNNYTCAVCPYTCIQNTHRYIYRILCMPQIQDILPGPEF